jgi:hypothetical protein
MLRATINRSEGFKARLLHSPLAQNETTSVVKVMKDYEVRDSRSAT